VISHKHKFIFVHIPRTGGTSVERFFNEPINWGNHNSLQWYSQSFGEYDRYFKFAFVRNPWDKMLSEYFWFRNTKHLYPDETVKKFFRKSASCFSEFVPLFLNSVEGDLSHRLSQLEFLQPINDMDYIGRLEKYSEDFVKICSHLGIDTESPLHENYTTHRPYWEYYDDETRQIVAEKYAKDIEYFGYEFGE
jgi:chondroitin 4-sulfotransferase 11